MALCDIDWGSLVRAFARLDAALDSLSDVQGLATPQQCELAQGYISTPPRPWRGPVVSPARLAHSRLARAQAALSVAQLEADAAQCLQLWDPGVDPTEFGACDTDDEVWAPAYVPRSRPPELCPERWRAGPAGPGRTEAL